MKTMFTFLSLVVITASGFAQWKNNGPNNNGQYPNNTGQYPNNNGQYNNYQNSALIVNTYSSNRFTVMIDNNYQYQSDRNTVNVGTLNAGNHTVTIYEMKTGFFGKQKQQVVYNANLYFKPNVETTLSINNYGQAGITERQLYNNNNGGYDNNGNGKGNGYGRMKQKHKKNQCDNDDRSHNDCNRDDRREW